MNTINDFDAFVNQFGNDEIPDDQEFLEFPDHDWGDIADKIHRLTFFVCENDREVESDEYLLHPDFIEGMKALIRVEECKPFSDEYRAELEELYQKHRAIYLENLQSGLSMYDGTSIEIVDSTIRIQFPNSGRYLYLPETMWEDVSVD